MLIRHHMHYCTHRGTHSHRSTHTHARRGSRLSLRAARNATQQSACYDVRSASRTCLHARTMGLRTATSCALRTQLCTACALRTQSARLFSWAYGRPPALRTQLCTPDRQPGCPCHGRPAGTRRGRRSCSSRGCAVVTVQQRAPSRGHAGGGAAFEHAGVYLFPTRSPRRSLRPRATGWLARASCPCEASRYRTRGRSSAVRPSSLESHLCPAPQRRAAQITSWSAPGCSGRPRLQRRAVCGCHRRLQAAERAHGGPVILCLRRARRRDLLAPVGLRCLAGWRGRGVPCAHRSVLVCLVCVRSKLFWSTPFGNRRRRRLWKASCFGQPLLEAGADFTYM